MAKTLVLALALWTGVSNFAYASARLECASMMQQTASSSSRQVKADHSCCESTPCQCAIKQPLSQQSVPLRAVNSAFGQTAALPLSSTEAVLPASTFFITHTSESPPEHPPLYVLFSVYRI